MLFSTRKLLFFGGRFLVFLFLLTLVYPWVIPGYHRLITEMASQIVSDFKPFMDLRVSAEGGLDVYVPQKGRTGPLFSIEGSYLALIYFNLVLIGALLLATPELRGWQRLKLLYDRFGVAADSPRILHSRYGTSRTITHYDPQNLFYNGLYYLVAIGGQLFGVMLWALLTFRYWLPKPTVPAAVQTKAEPDRDAPCPCGSGKKYKRCCGKDT